MKTNTIFLISIIYILLFFNTTNLSAQQCDAFSQPVGGDRHATLPSYPSLGNTFTPICTAKVESVTCHFLVSNSAGQTYLTVELYRDPLNNNDGRTLLTSATQQVSILTQNTYSHTINLPGEVQLTAGVEYGVRMVQVRDGIPLSEQRNLIWSLNENNPYPDGRYFWGDNNGNHFLTSDQWTGVSIDDRDIKFDVNYIDEDPPVAMCQNITRYLGTNNTVTIQPNDIDNGSFDLNSTITNYTISQNTFNCSNVGENTVILTLEDEAGNMATCEAIVTILDTVAPVITCPEDITVYTDEGVPAIINYDNPVASEECAMGIPSGFSLIGTWGDKTYFLSNYQEIPEFAFATAEALGGHLATVLDQDHNNFLLSAVPADAFPILIGYNDISQEGNFVWQSGASSNYNNWAAGEPNNVNNEDYTVINSNGEWNDVRNTGGARRFVIELSHNFITQTAGLPSGSAFPVGVTTNTFQAIDASGNVGECSFTVNVFENITPVAVCQNPTKQIPDISLPPEITIAPSELDGGSTANLLLIESDEFIVDITADNPTDLLITNTPWHYQEFAFMVPSTGSYTFTLSGDSGSNLVVWDRPIAPNSGWLWQRPGRVGVGVYSANGTLTNGTDTHTLNAGQVYYMSLLGFDPGYFFSGTLQINNDINGSLSKYISDPCAIDSSISETLYAVSYFGEVASCVATIYIDDVRNRCNPFITKWETTTNNESITIPTTNGETYDYAVDWGDGTVESGFTGDAVHTYATAGEYEVRISGTFPRIEFDTNFDPNRLKIKEVTQWGSNPWTSMENAFFGCENLDVTAADIPDLSNVTNMRSMFFYCINLQGTPEFNDWDVSNVTNMYETFLAALVFNQNISSWNVSSVADMTGMFYAAHAFNQDIGNWDVSSVSSMKEMFREALAFNQNLGNWDISSLSNAASMLNDAPLSIENYDNTLIGWATLGTGENQIPNGVSLNAFGNQYCESYIQRFELIDIYAWNITDGGKSCPKFQPRVYLQGASLNANGGTLNLMRDDLRANNLIPTTSPYDGITTCDPSVFSSDDDEAIVDWVLVELRDASDATNIIHSQSCLIQRDGFIVSTDLTILTAPVKNGSYHIVVKHRNHLGVMSAASITINETSVTQIDFTNGTVPTYGTNAQTSFGMPAGVLGMWTGNVNGDVIVQYIGVNSDIPGILSVVLNNFENTLGFSTHIVNGYDNHDVNMDGSIQYTGAPIPDTPFILQNVLAHPGNFLNFSTYQIIEQLPENE